MSKKESNKPREKKTEQGPFKGRGGTMGSKLLFALLLILALIMPAFTQQAQESVPPSGVLKVVISGFKNDKGEVKIALSDSEENYLSKGKVFKGTASQIKDRKAEGVFHDISYGEYAVKVYHDMNGNNKLDTNFLGIPKESHGFSNNVRGTLGMPKWEKAKFVFEKKDMLIEIKVE